MKIGILSNTNYIDFPTGGTLSFLRNYLKYTRIDYILFGPAIGKCDKRRIIINNKKYRFIPIYCEARGKINRFKGAKNTLFKIKKIEDEVDFLYIHHPEMGAVISRFSDLPYIYHMHGANYRMIYSKHKFMRNSLFSWIFKNMVLASTKRARAVIGVTKECKTLTPQNVPFYYIPIAVDTEIFHPVNDMEKRSLREELNIPLDSLVWLYVGRLGKVKNVGFIVETFYQFLKKYNSRAFLVLVGDGEERNNIINKIRELKITQYVKMVGSVPHSYVHKYYKASDIFMMASYAEGLPNSLLEAMACGLVVIAPRIGGISEVLNNGYNGITFNKYEPEKILKNIEKDIENKEFLIENASSTIKRYFAINQLSNKIDEIIIDSEVRI